MNSYFIKLHNNTIFVCEMYSELCILTRNAEDEQPYQKENFWKWFKEKIEYDDEELCFVVATDEDSFEVCSSIRIAQKHTLSNSDIRKMLVNQINKNLKIKYMPERTLEIERCSTNEDIQSIQSYYQKQTIAYKRK